MAFRDRSESRAAPRRKPRRSSSPGKGTGPLAPAPSGVFAQRKVARQDVVAGGRARAQRKVQRAEGGLPTTTLPVKRLPTIAKPTHRQAAATVREQRQALRGTSVAARDSAARGNADAETRRQLHNLTAAQQRLDVDQHVKIGVAAISADPGKYGLTGGHVARLHSLAKQGRLPESIRKAVGAVGAAQADAGRARAVQAKERADHGVGAGLEAVAGLKLSKGAGLLAAATGKAANDLGNRALRGTGAGSDENALKHLVEDAKHFPYDAVRSGAQVAQAGADLSKFLPHGPREVVGGLAGIPGIAVTALADAQGGKGSAKKGRAIAGSVDDGALGALLGGHPALALKRAGEHPLYTAAEASGAYSAAGRVLGATVRGAGAAGRLAGKGERLRALGDTRRPDLVLEPGARGLRLDRSYSKNLLTALEQKRRDRVDIRKGLGARNKRGEVDGIAFRGSDRARARAMRQAVHEFADTQQNTGRTERETARRSAQTATGRRGESGRQRAQRVLEEGLAELRRRGVDTSGMSGVERAKAAAAMGVKLEQDRGVRARAGRRATAVKSSAKVRAERAVPTKVALPRVPFSAKGGAAWRVRPERELLGAAAKQLIGDVRSSLPQVADKLRSEIDRLEQAYEGSHREMDLPGRRANRNRVGAMKALLHDIETGKRGVEGRVARLMGRGEEYRRVAGGISRAMVQAKLLTPEQAKNAALMDYAVSRFADQGVRHNPERMPTDADAAAYAARKGEAASAGAAARQAGREASQARVESARAGRGGRGWLRSGARGS
jgi:hypothetical protein